MYAIYWNILFLFILCDHLNQLIITVQAFHSHIKENQDHMFKMFVSTKTN